MKIGVFLVHLLISVALVSQPYFFVVKLGLIVGLAIVGASTLNDKVAISFFGCFL